MKLTQPPIKIKAKARDIVELNAYLEEILLNFDDYKKSFTLSTKVTNEFTRHSLQKLAEQTSDIVFKRIHNLNEKCTLSLDYPQRLALNLFTTHYPLPTSILFIETETRKNLLA
jgi:hypothetical protein